MTVELTGMCLLFDHWTDSWSYVIVVYYIAWKSQHLQSDSVFENQLQRLLPIFSLNKIIEESWLVLCVTTEQTDWTFAFVFCSKYAKFLKSI